VFPIEWVVTENILNQEKVNLDFASLEKLRDCYQEILRDELKSRNAMENLIK